MRRRGGIGAQLRRIGFALLAAVLLATACTDEDGGSDAASAQESAAPPTTLAQDETVESSAGGPVPVIDVDLVDAAVWLDGLPEAERTGQIEDWLVLALAAELGLETGELRDLLFDKTVLRAELLAELSAWGTTSGRRLAVGDVLHLIVDADDAHPSRTIGSLLDDHRTERGTDPRLVEVHRYRVEGPTVRLGSEGRRGLDEIRAEHGYVTATIETVEELEAFLGQVDHLSGLAIGPDLRAIGWDWPEGTPGGRITVEDLTVLQTSYEAAVAPGSITAPPGFSLDPPSVLAPGYAVEGADLAALLPSADPDFVRAIEDIRAGVAAEQLGEVQLDALFDGFTTPTAFCRGWTLVFWLPDELDPACFEDGFVDRAELDALMASPELLDPAFLAEQLELDDPELARQLAADLAVRLANDALYSNVDHAAVPTDRVDLWTANQLIGGQDGFSAARYDGDLAGTEAGMTLFYTDLIAKDWTSGVGDGVPDAVTDVPGFVTMPSLETPWSYCTEIGAESGRLWFGADQDTVDASTTAISISSDATRLFARTDAGGGVEVETSYTFGLPLRWWDQHFRAVADHEPQFHRLDQLMRWSQAIDWLVARGSVRLPEAPSASIERGWTFAQWYAANDQLRERTPVSFVDVPGYPVDTETIRARPSESYDDCGWNWVTGGVSLADDFVRHGVDAFRPPTPPTLRRPGVFDPRSGIDDVTGNGTIIRAGGRSPLDGGLLDLVEYRLGSGLVEVRAFPRSVQTLADTRLLVPDGAERSVLTRIDAGDGRIAIDLETAGAPLGTVLVEGAGGRYALAVDLGPLGSARSLLRGLGNGVDGPAVRSAVGRSEFDFGIVEPSGRVVLRHGSGDAARWWAIDDATGGSASTPAFRLADSAVANDPLGQRTLSPAATPSMPTGEVSASTALSALPRDADDFVRLYDRTPTPAELDEMAVLNARFPVGPAVVRSFDDLALRFSEVPEDLVVLVGHAPEPGVLRFPGSADDIAQDVIEAAGQEAGKHVLVLSCGSAAVGCRTLTSEDALRLVEVVDARLAIGDRVQVGVLVDEMVSVLDDLRTERQLDLDVQLALATGEVVVLGVGAGTTAGEDDVQG
ncbi:MAG: hypothetical protein AAFZ07_19285 [Actinomycetota bacterium]